MLSELWSDLRYRYRALFRRGTLERDLEEELKYHLERETEKYLAQGVAPAEAGRRARLAFGGVEVAKEASRDGRGIVALETLARDVHYAARSLRRNPGFAAITVLCLGLGLAAVTTAYGVVDVLFLRPPPGVGDAGSVVRPYLTVKNGARLMNASGALHYAGFVEVRQGARSLSGLAGYTGMQVIVGSGLAARHAMALLVTDNYFAVLRVRPALGRFLTPDEDAGPGSPPVAVVSWGLWKGLLGGAPQVIGRRLMLSGHPFTIVGVAPRGFSGIDAGLPDLWLPLSRAADFGTSRDQVPLLTVGRLAQGVSRSAAEAELGPVFTRALHVPWGEGVVPRFTLGPALYDRGPTPTTESRIALWLALAAGLVLAIACANAASLLLTRGLARRKEFALRLSLGSGRWRLVRQLLLETGLLALGGMGLGLLLAWWGTVLLPALGLPVVAFFAHGRVLVFAVTAATACVLLFGLAPALTATRTDLAAVVKEGSREGGAARSQARAALVVAQVALAALLLVGAGLFLRSLRNAQAIRPGFEVDRLLLASPDFTGTETGDSGSAAFLDQALERVRRLPGVRGATLADIPPLAGWWNYRAYTVPDGADRTAYQGMEPTRAIALSVGAGYFAAVGTPMLAGRDLADADRTGAPVVVVNRAFADHQWPGRSALGRCIDIGQPGKAVCHRVVGVAADSRYVSLEEVRRLAMFLPIQEDPAGSRVLIIRSWGAPASLGSAVRRALIDLDPALAYVDVSPLADHLREELRPRRLAASLFGGLGFLALILAAVGLYGVVSFAVARRSHELGVRMALGARSTQVVAGVLGRGMALTILGLAIGLLAALATTRFVAHLLLGVAPTDPLTFAVVAFVLGASAALASLIPARRATRVDPVIALRVE